MTKSTKEKLLLTVVASITSVLCTWIPVAMTKNREIDDLKKQSPEKLIRFDAADASKNGKSAGLAVDGDDCSSWNANTGTAEAGPIELRGEFNSLKKIRRLELLGEAVPDIICTGEVELLSDSSTTFCKLQFTHKVSKSTLIPITVPDPYMSIGVKKIIIRTKNSETSAVAWREIRAYGLE